MQPVDHGHREATGPQAAEQVDVAGVGGSAAAAAGRGQRRQAVPLGGPHVEQLHLFDTKSEDKSLGA